MARAFDASGVCVDEVSAPAGDASSLLQSDDKPPSDVTPQEDARNSLILRSPSLHLPVIDLAPALQAPVQPAGGSCDRQAGPAEVVSAMLSAAKEWGFFQVVNHGVPVELLERMVLLARGFFCLPSEQKERGLTADRAGYSTFAVEEGLSVEGICLNSLLAEPSAEKFANSVWPGGNPAFCETAVKVVTELDALKSHILELLAEGMGLALDFFTRPFDELKAAGQANRGAHLRINYYPPRRADHPYTAMGNHTDPTVTSLLYQDAGNSLYILDKDDTTWHLVEYKRDGLVFIVGDILQGWSNGVLPAGIHRVVLDGDKSRISFLNGSMPPPDTILQPATVPVDEIGESRPAHYKPFTYRELYASYTNGHKIGHTVVDEKGRKGVKFIFENDESH